MPRKNELPQTICRLYQETYSQVQNNGHMSKEFLLESGVRQGCLLSFFLYCVQNNVFSYDILKEIKGFNIPGRKENLKLSQCTNDTSFMSCNFEDIPLLLINFQNIRRLEDVRSTPIKQKGC